MAKISNEHLQSVLQTKHILSDKDKDNDELLHLIIDEIGKKVLDGLVNVINVIIDNAKLEEKYDEIQEIYQVIKDIKINYENESSDDFIDNNNQENEYKNNLCPFDLLSVASIDNICSFLERDDISSLKLTSYQFGMVCLQYMTKKNFGICNVDQFIKYPKYHENVLYLHSEKYPKINHETYHSSTKIRALYDISNQKYNIPPKYQLLYNIQTGFDKRYGLNSNETINQFCKEHRNAFLFDLRNIVIIPYCSKPRIMANTDKDKLNEYDLVLLQYFDTDTTKLYIIQVLLIEEKVHIEMLRKYIENNFISTCNEQKKWYDKLQNNLQSLSSQQSKLIFFGGTFDDLCIRPLEMNNTAIDVFSRNDGGHGLLTIQLNNNKEDVMNANEFYLQIKFSEDWVGNSRPTRRRYRSELPPINFSFDDPEFLLRYEKLKVCDLEQELEQTLVELDTIKQERETLRSQYQSIQRQLSVAIASKNKFENELNEAIYSKNELATQSANEILRLSLILNSLQQLPKYKDIVQCLMDESYKH